MSFFRWLLLKGIGLLGFVFLVMGFCVEEVWDLSWIGVCLLVIGAIINIIYNKRNKSK